MKWNRYNAIVSKTDDPKMLGRIKVKCEDLVAKGIELPIWIPPALMCASKSEKSAPGGSGWFFVPQEESRVIIEILAEGAGDEIRWESFVSNPKTARYYPAPYSENLKPSTDFTEENYPNRRGFMTPSGHVVVFDDTEDSETITIRHMNDTTFLTMDQDGVVTLQSTEQTFAKMEPDGTVTVQSKENDSFIVMGADGTTVVHAAIVKIDKDADTHLVRGEDLKAWIDAHIQNYYNTHIHPTGTGPSGVPTVPGVILPDSALSSNHMVE